MLFVGNDVVDLRNPETIGKSKNKRFVQHVFSPHEQQMIQESSCPDKMLWTLWACKETAYKIMVKMLPGISFSWKSFGVKKLQTVSSRHAEAQAVYQSKSVSIRIAHGSDSIHAVGYSHNAEEEITFTEGLSEIPASFDPEMLSRFSAKENQSIKSWDSAWVRFCAKMQLAEKLRVSLKRLEIIRDFSGHFWNPPEVFMDQKRLPINLSLSHHGRWSAWAWSQANS